MERTQYEKLSLINGKIHTQTGTASNITFEHGRIVSIDNEIGHDGKVIDLKGRTVLPAFCLTGINFLDWSENQERLNLAGINSVQEFSDAFEKYSQEKTKPLRGWYIAYGLSDDVIISHEDLDAVISENPCAVIEANNNHAVLNTPAMNEFNMPQDNVELDEFTEHLPSLTREDIFYLVENYGPKINALGISEVWVDFDGTAKRFWDIFSFGEIYDALTFRLRANFSFQDVSTLNNFLSSGLRTGDGLPFCKIGGVIIGGEIPQEEQKNMIISAHFSGCQIISDVDKYCLNILERVIKKTRRHSRHLLRNFTLSPQLLERMRILGLGGIISESNKEFLHEAFQSGLVLSSGAITSPLKNIAELVSNGLSVSEAINIYTWGAAWNGGNILRRGELSTGNDADIIVLEEDPFSAKDISSIKIAMTFCAGCMVYEA